MMRLSYLLLMTVWLLAQWVCAQAPTVQTEGGLKFHADARGNHLPDFSFCGYAASEQPIPSVPTRLKLEPSGHDDTQRIAAALKQLASLSRDKDGWHGALELGAGTFHVSGQVELTDERLVIRGAVDDRGALSTTIIATGKSRRALFHLGRQRQPQDAIHQQLVARVTKSTAVGAQRLDVQWNLVFISKPANRSSLKLLRPVSGFTAWVWISFPPMITAAHGWIGSLAHSINRSIA